MRWSGGVSHACKLAGVVALALVLGACARHGEPKEYGLGSTGGVSAPGSPQEFATNVGDLVHFQEDSSALSGEAQNILRNQARWLNQYSQYTITIQGHADERGTREYNLALGARRATTVRTFLAQVGVESGAHSHRLLRQGAADCGVRCAVLLEPESSGPDRAEQRRRRPVLGVDRRRRNAGAPASGT